MKKGDDDDTMRAEYTAADFPGGFTRGKYAARMKAASNVVLLRPEVAEAFPNEEAVNNALQSLIDLAKKSVHTAS